MVQALKKAGPNPTRAGLMTALTQHEPGQPVPLSGRQDASRRPTERFPIDQQILEQYKSGRLAARSGTSSRRLASALHGRRRRGTRRLRPSSTVPAWSRSSRAASAASRFDAAVRDRPRPLLLPAVDDAAAGSSSTPASARATPRRAGGRCSTSSTHRSSAIVVTHMHPDHVGGARDVAELTGAPVFQGREDHAQCVRAWGERNPERVRARTGRPHGHARRARCAGSLQESDRLVAAVHWVRAARAARRRATSVDGWRVEVLRGHADGHIVLLRDGVLIAGDMILDGITPAIGLYPNSRPDPLADYFETLGRIEELAPRIAYAGHKEPVARPCRARPRDPRAPRGAARPCGGVARARRRARPTRSRSSLFDADLSTTLRRFATAEALAHLERLVARAAGRRAPAAAT